MESRVHSASERSTRRLLRSIPHVPSMKRHEINENYYRVKKVRGKIKTLAVRSESGIAVTIERSPSESCASGLFGKMEDEALSTLRALFQIIGQPICRRCFARSSCVQQSLYAQTLMFSPKIRIVVCS